MPQALIFFDEKEDKHIIEVAEQYNISKHEAIKRIVREHKEMRKELDAVT